MDQFSYLIMVEVPAMGPMHDLIQALQRAYTEGAADGSFQVIVTREPGYMACFLRSVRDGDMQYLLDRVKQGARSLQLAAMHQLAAELSETAGDAARPVIEDLENGDAQILDFNGVLGDTQIAQDGQSHQPADSDEDTDFDDRSKCYQHYHLGTRPDGQIEGTANTNDNLDVGYPSEDAQWPVRYRSREEMERQTGKSHVGISGCQVVVYLDGEKI